MRRIDLSTAQPRQLPEILRRQWLVTNGLGGYASGTISGAVTWRYHGLLISALPAPYGRTVMLNHLAEYLRLPDGSLTQFGGGEPDDAASQALHYLREFRIEHQMPVWSYEVAGVRIEKRIVMPNRQNTVHVTYAFQAPAPGTWLELRPSVHFRGIEESASQPFTTPYEVRVIGRHYEFDSRQGLPPLRLALDAADFRFIHEGGWSNEFSYHVDAERGFEARGTLWTPGYFSIPVGTQPITLIASTEEWHTVAALDAEAAYSTERDRTVRLIRSAHAAARSGPPAALVLAADQFIIIPAGRVRDAARARAAGDELRSVIAGYHWFTDWGRDTMISLEGLTLTTGRYQEAAWILRAFAQYVRDGLLPNMFPEGRNEGLYHTADATLWFFYAIHRYVEVTGDRNTLTSLLPLLRDIVERHLKGTHFGIGVDPDDGLLRQGAKGYQLTWMDAKVGDWVVTPRRGKAVEINALWYNALSLLAIWCDREGDPSAGDVYRRHAEQAEHAFNRRFWNAATGCLLDVVDGEGGDDPSVRPNQVLSISLPHPVLRQERWDSVMRVVETELLTPVGLRSLSPRHPDYKPQYTGDLRARDAAYHQGTVWAWLIGPYIDAWLKLHPDRRSEAHRLLAGFVPHLEHACVGSISEIFDAHPPYNPRGCIAQAWSVAEVLRCWVLTTNTETAEED